MTILRSILKPGEVAKTIEMGAASVITAVASAFGLQVTNVPWAAEFLTEYGWLGLFLLSAALNAYLFKQVNKTRKEMVGVHKKELAYQRERHDRERDRAERMFDNTMEKLLEEYRIRIKELSK